MAKIYSEMINGEWVEADITLDSEELAERSSALLGLLGFNEEDKHDPPAFAKENPFSEVARSRSLARCGAKYNAGSKRDAGTVGPFSSFYP